MTEKEYINLTNLTELRTAMRALHNVMPLDVDFEAYKKICFGIQDMIRKHEELVDNQEMPELPDGLDCNSNCDRNFKNGWIACWEALNETR